jgi:glutathione S-transferase
VSEPLLVQVGYSPWSLKARLALGLAGLRHRRLEYLPMLREPWLRWRLRRFAGRVTVPVLLTDQGALTDSFDIARLALAGGPYWPEDAGLVAWNVWSERLLELGRTRTTRRVLTDPVALRASLPAGLGGLGPLSTWVARSAAWYLLRKYGLTEDETALEARMDALLDQLAGVLADQPYLLGRLSYADVAAAAGLCFVSPPTDLPVDPTARPHWTVPALAERYAPLLAWRDRVLAECAAQAPRVGRP